jgi:hypothetical protein
MVELWTRSVISFSNGYVLLYLACFAAFTEMIDGSNLFADQRTGSRHGDRKRLYLIRD